MSDVSPDPPAGRRWGPIALGVLGLALAIVIIVALVQNDDGETATTTTAQSSSPLPEASDPDAVELGHLLDVGKAATYHATYTLAGGKADDSGDIALEVWRAGDQLRQDTVSTVDGQQVQTSSFVTNGDVILCSKSGDAEWTCAKTVPSGTEQDGVIGSVLSQLQGKAITPRDDEIDGRKVRCFAFESDEGAGDLCVTPEGVPAQVLIDDAGITLVAIDRNVPTSAFRPPAAPTTATTG